MLERRWFHIKYYFKQHSLELIVFVLLLVFFVIFSAERMFYTIPAGSVGVLWERFRGGTVRDHPLGQGFHVIMPWNKIYIYNLRVQLGDEMIDVLSRDGLNLKIDVAFRFEVKLDTVTELHDFVGPDYVNVLIAPDISANARDVFAQNTPEEIYSLRRVEIQKTILDRVNAHLTTAFNQNKQQLQYINVEDVLIRSIALPASVEAAINSKNEQQQRNLEYDYRILREAKEAERKRIEAAGIRQFTDTTGANFDAFLRLSGIAATLELAQSPNAKVVIVGNKDGLPLILGNLDTSAPGVKRGPLARTSPSPSSASDAAKSSALSAMAQKLGIPIGGGAANAPAPGASARPK